IEGLTVSVFEIINHFFGESVTVSGLLTAQDLEAQLKGKDLGDALLISENMLRDGEEIFLDDVTLSQLSERLNIPIFANRTDGFDLFERMIGE
ncbi:MAG TPA: radical SAM protein, partial [Ruminococcaceae bacterium]|nr:radical SAM protein [Oscillospiraceae bacterium]